MKRPPEVGLGHEAIHAYHRLTNTTAADPLVKETNTTGVYRKFPYTENETRKDVGLPARPRF